MCQHDRHRVKSVAQIVRDYTHRDQQSDLRAALKADSDRDTIEKAVKRQTGRRQRPELLLMRRRRVLMLARSMHRRVPFEREERQKSTSRERYVRCTVLECKDLG